VAFLINGIGISKFFVKNQRDRSASA
jgi:hypothetical protein